ncbi:unnamed protein product, partial [Nesidiocoris tenuis]
MFWFLGIATQTILTMPINAVSNNQMVNIPMANGQVMTTPLANLVHQYTSGASPTPGNLGPAIPSTLPHLLNGHSQHQQHLLNAYQQQAQAQQAAQQQQVAAAVQQQAAAAAAQHVQQQQAQQQQPIALPSQKSPLSHSPYNSSLQNCSKSPPINMNGGGGGSGGAGLVNGGCAPQSTQPQSQPQPAPSGVAPSGVAPSPSSPICRLAASNNDLTITTTSGGSKYPPPPPQNQQPHPPPPPASHHGSTLDLMDDPKFFFLYLFPSALATQMYCAAQLASQQQSMHRDHYISSPAGLRAGSDTDLVLQQKASPQEHCPNDVQRMHPADHTGQNVGPLRRIDGQQRRQQWPVGNGRGTEEPTAIVNIELQVDLFHSVIVPFINRVPQRTFLVIASCSIAIIGLIFLVIETAAVPQRW